jgi:sortase A
MTATEVVDLSEFDDEMTDAPTQADDRQRRRNRWRGGTSRPPARGAVAVAIRAVLAASLLAAWGAGYALALSSLQEARSQAELYASLRESLADPQSEPTGAISPGTPVVLLQAPRAGIHDMVVVEGTAAGDLQAGPGHRRDTVLPGQPGVSVLMGRSTTFGAPFGLIAHLRPGDVVSTTTAQGTFAYRVDRVRYAGDPLPPALALNAGRLTLVSSTDSGWRSGWTPGGTVYVDASLQGAAVAIPPGRPATVPPAEEAMAADPGALMPLVLWLQALALVVLGMAVSRFRWGGWQTWLIGGPLMVAALWGASSAAIQLLPNLF